MNPHADVMGRGQALDIDPDWRPTRQDRQAADLTKQDHPDLERLARKMAQERQENNPDAWIWYIGWAAHNIGSTGKRLRAEGKPSTYDDIKREVGL